MGNEIFFNTCSILKQTRYSNSLNYFLYKRQLKMAFRSILRNRCVNTGLARSVDSKLKLSRFIQQQVLILEKYPDFIVLYDKHKRELNVEIAQLV